jgi:hypothetical protein
MLRPEPLQPGDDGRDSPGGQAMKAYPRKCLYILAILLSHALLFGASCAQRTALSQEHSAVWKFAVISDLFFRHLSFFHPANGKISRALRSAVGRSLNRTVHIYPRFSIRTFVGSCWPA